MFAAVLFYVLFPNKLDFVFFEVINDGIHCLCICLIQIAVLQSGADSRGCWGDRPPKTYESNFVHHDF